MNNPTKILRKARNKLPTPNPKYAQYFCTEKTVLDRIKLLSELTKNKSKRFLFIGDDDFVSLMVAALSCTDEITVLEADPKVRSIIKEAAVHHNLPVDVHSYDVRDPLPREFINKRVLNGMQSLEM